MTKLNITPLAAQGVAVREALRMLNNANASETSFLSPEEWESLLAATYSATCIGRQAFLTALDQDADYEGQNFAWFRDRFPRFIYIDRIVVADALRGKGVGRLLYDHLFGRARAAGYDLVGCEINFSPPNPGSDAFHTRLGFVEAGHAALSGRSKTVRYFTKSLRPC